MALARSRGAEAAGGSPIFLAADSRPLFGALGATRFAERVAAELRDAAWMWGPRAAYVGACSADEPAYYEIFELFAEAASCPKRMHVRTPPSDAERAFLEEADLIVIGGGDPLAGLDRLEAATLVEPLRRAWLGGAVLLGVSAGAMLLGLGVNAGGGWRATLGLCPFPVETGPDVEETLEALARAPLSARRGIGIPPGRAAIVHRDGTLEPIGGALLEAHLTDDGTLRRAELLPPEVPSSPGDGVTPS